MIFALFLLLFASVDSANILGIFPYPYYSHQKLHATITQALLDRGHSLTIFVTFPQNFHKHPNVTQHLFSDTLNIHNDYTDMLMYKRKKLHWTQIIIQHEIPAYFHASLNEMAHPEMQKLIHNSSDYKFDLIITECVFCPHFMLADIFDCPIAFVSSSEAHETVHRIVGNGVDPLRHSDAIFFPHIHGRLSTKEVVSSIAFRLFQEVVLNPVFFLLQAGLNLKFFRHLGVKNALTFPYNRISLAMTYTSPAFGHVRALMPNSIQIGFLHVEEAKEVKEATVKSFLDASENGVVVMSLGSRADPRQLGMENVQKFIRAFNRTDMNILWKLHAMEDEDELEIPSNVRIVKWMPLADVLAHPNVKLLIYHGGLLTTYEAIDREVPMIVFPLAYDQKFNARLMRQNGLAEQLDLNDFKADELTETIEKMKNPKYLKNVKEMKRLAYDRPMSSRDLMVWHVENAIRNRVSYADRFGSVSFIESPAMPLVMYILLFAVPIFVLVKRKLRKD